MTVQLPIRPHLLGITRRGSQIANGPWPTSGRGMDAYPHTTRPVPSRSLFVPFNSLLSCFKFAVPAQLTSDAVRRKALFRCTFLPSWPLVGSQIPVKFPDNSEFAVEKGSRWTAPTASHPCGMFSVGGRDEFLPTFPVVVLV